MKIIELNRPAISGKLAINEVNVRPYVNGEPYMTESRVVHQADIKNPVYRIAKDYDNNGLKFALNMIIKDNNVGKAEKWLDKLAKKVTEEQVTDAIKNVFTYLDERYKVK